MDKILKESHFYRIIIIVYSWIKKVFSESLFVNLFLRQKDYSDVIDSSLIVILYRKIIGLLRRVFCKLKLDALLDGSIFTKPIIWLSITVFLVPFLPTMLGLILIALTAFSLLLKLLINPNYCLKANRTNILIFLLIITICICAITSISTVESKNIALLISAFVMSYFLVINIVETRTQFKNLMYLLTIASVLTAFYGIYQYIFGDVYSQAWLDSTMFEDIKMRVYATFENPNVYGEYLILMIPVIAALFWTEKGFWRKSFLLLSFGITMIALILTFSRGCWLGIILGLGILVIMIDKKFIGLGILALLILPFVLPDTIMNRFLSIGNLEDTSTSYRVYIWLGTIEMLKDYWFSGVGLGITSFNKVYPIYSYNTVTAPHSHNLFLQLIVEYGIIGLAIFIGIIYQFYKATISSYIKEKNIWISAFIGGISGFLLQSLFDNTWYNYRVVLIFWIFLAMGFASTKLKDDE